MKILFLLKKKAAYSCGYDRTAASGLFNSAKFVADMLNAAGVKAKVEEVVDNNSIDKAVHDYRPNVAVIEALWVVPEKFDILKKFHPSVRWIVRLHSDIPFLAGEGIACDWIFGYLKTKRYIPPWGALYFTRNQVGLGWDREVIAELHRRARLH